METLIEQRLGDYAFHKSVFPAPEEAGAAAFGFKLWRDTAKKGIAETVLLREAAHNGTRYRVYAYAIHGEIPAGLLEQLKAIVAEAELSEIRYEAFGVKGFSNLYDAQGECFQDDYTLLPLYRQMDGVFLAVVAEDDGDPEELDCPAAAYAVDGTGMYQWCIARRYLEPGYSYPPTSGDPDQVPEETDEDVLEMLNEVLGMEGEDLSACVRMMDSMQTQQQAAEMAGAFFAQGVEAAQNLPDAPSQEDVARACQEMMAKQMAAFGAMMGQMYGVGLDGVDEAGPGSSPDGAPEDPSAK